MPAAVAMVTATGLTLGFLTSACGGCFSFATLLGVVTGLAALGLCTGPPVLAAPFTNGDDLLGGSLGSKKELILDAPLPRCCAVDEALQFSATDENVPEGTHWFD